MLFVPQDTDRFCADVLCAPEMVSYANQNFVAWGGDVRYADAFQVGQATARRHGRHGDELRDLRRITAGQVERERHRSGRRGFVKQRWRLHGLLVVS